jgi:tRNA G18 (ribose-2'-O)-methylase SpoU
VPKVQRVESVDDARLADYVRLTDTSLRRVLEPAGGLFVAEGDKVIRRALASGYPVHSLLTSPRWLDQALAALGSADAPVYVADDAMLESLTGYDVHRGALASMGRLPLPTTAELLAGVSRVVVLEGVVDPTNVGAVFRGAAALGMDAVLLDPTCADPLYRRSVKVSMGAVFALPYARAHHWPADLDLVRSAGLSVLALTPAESATPLDELDPSVTARCALLFGTEGPGLTMPALAAADLAVRIPMAHGVDSLNVAAAAAVAFWAVTRQSGGRR